MNSGRALRVIVLAVIFASHCVSHAQAPAPVAAPAPAPASCPDCFVSIGIGANMDAKSYSDYTNSANILQATHLV
jgi:hypothetical protein